ncbi:MAG: hypothetical protein ACOXZV_06015 [Bacteroidales bacterium]|jgi:hypothetical protein
MNTQTQEETERIQYAESVAYVYFAEHFSKYFKLIKKMNYLYSDFDCSGITITNHKIIIEFKIRDKEARMYSGSTMIENKKLKVLQAIWEQDKTIEVKYICYFNDVCISFNLSERFKQGGNSDILFVTTMPCKHTTMRADNQVWNKKVNFLCFNAEMWRDKLIEY